MKFQAILIEGVESLLINLDLKKVAQKALESASENLKRDPYSQRSHSILFVKNKLLAMCSRFVLNFIWNRFECLLMDFVCVQPNSSRTVNERFDIPTSLLPKIRDNR